MFCFWITLNNEKAITNYREILCFIRVIKLKFNNLLNVDNIEKNFELLVTYIKMLIEKKSDRKSLKLNLVSFR